MITRPNSTPVSTLAPTPAVIEVMLNSAKPESPELGSGCRHSPVASTVVMSGGASANILVAAEGVTVVVTEVPGVPVPHTTAGCCRTMRLPRVAEKPNGAVAATASVGDVATASRKRHVSASMMHVRRGAAQRKWHGALGLLPCGPVSQDRPLVVQYLVANQVDHRDSDVFSYELPLIYFISNSE